MRTIKNLRVKNRIFLAPMLEYNDIAFRLLCKKAGRGLTYTGMINSLDKREIKLDDKPAIQLFSCDGKGISEFIKKYDSKVQLWDFNLGCPSSLAKEKKFGFYLQNLEVIEKILKEMRSSTKKPVTIKFRISNINERLIEIAEKYCDAICIHPRTCKQGYSGLPDIDYAINLRKKTRLPVIYSGNVNEKNCKQLLKKFDYVMIGREAIGNPNIFSNKKKYSFGDYLKLAKKFGIKFAQIKLQAMAFTKGLFGAGKIRLQISKAKNNEEILRVYKNLKR